MHFEASQVHFSYQYLLEDSHEWPLSSQICRTCPLHAEVLAYV
ncbi:hypothetical protein MtrunA17_Chr3g0103041 [Medicago truncatula]|uniref:Uncharacterized protein n=1 Tax=Medicago truncatula TaxID=3880 RepID=A0A396IX14_MEDTR|nr:hypothetical protein MtrunA17_Chr3g0103041 [Medicago truncatula]